MNRDIKKFGMGLAFCSPWIVGMIIFLGYPLAKSISYSFTRVSLLRPAKYVGMDHYQELMYDPLFWRSLYNTLVFTSCSVIFGLLVSFCLALLLNCKIKGIAIYRTIFFLPSLMPVVAGSFLWLYIYKADGGLLNSTLEHMGWIGPAWLQDPAWIKTALIMMTLWGAGHGMVIILAGLQDIPSYLYEACLLDGAGFWGRLMHVTIPMVSPVIYFNMIMGLISGLQVFSQGFLMTGVDGGPERAGLFYVMYIS